MAQLAKPESLTRETEPPTKGAPKLSLVGRQNPALRAAQLLAEARAVAAEQVAALDAALAVVRDLAAEIAEGGDLYSPGLRDVCRRLSDDLMWKSKTINHLALDAPERARGPKIDPKG